MAKRLKKKANQYKKFLHPAAPYTHPEEKSNFAKLHNLLKSLVHKAGFRAETFGLP
jgi:hypothetical protein